MRLLTVTAEEFGLFQNRAFALDRPFTLIEGENESGKTTLQTLILFLLYGFPRHGEAATADRARGLSRKGRRAAGQMTFLCRGREWRLCRTYILQMAGGKESAYEECRVTDDTGAEVSLGGKTPGEYFLGIPRELYEACACVRQSEIAQVTDACTGDAVSELLFLDAGGARLDKATRALDAARRELQHTRGDGGRIAMLEEERVTLEGTLQQARADGETLRALREERADLAAQLQRTDDELSALRDAARVGELEEILERFADFHEAECEALRLSRLCCELEGEREKEASRVAEPLLATLREQVSREAALLSEREASAARLRAAQNAYVRCTGGTYYEKIEHLGGADKLETRARALEGRCRQTAFTGALLLMISLLLLGLSWPLAVWCTVLLAVGGGLLVCAATSFLLHVRVRGQIRRLLQMLSLSTLATLYTVLSTHRADAAAAAAAQAEQRACEKIYAEASAALTTLQHECSALARGHGILPQQTALQTLTLCLDQAATRAHTEDGALASARAQLAHARAEAEAISRTLSGLDEEALCRERGTYPAEIEGLPAGEAANRIAALQTVRDRITEELVTLTREEAVLAARACDPAGIASSLQETRAALGAARDRLAAIRMAQEALLEADRALRGSILPRVTDVAADILADLTDGRYGRLCLSDKFSVSLDTAEGLLPLCGFSAGCRDAVGLALRMALVRLIASEPLPLLFDEVAARLDDLRTARLLSLISSLAESGEQVLLFTCRGREATMLGTSVARICL